MISFSEIWNGLRIICSPRNWPLSVLHSCRVQQITRTSCLFLYDWAWFSNLLCGIYLSYYVCKLYAVLFLPCVITGKHGSAIFACNMFTGCIIAFMHKWLVSQYGPEILYFHFPLSPSFHWFSLSSRQSRQNMFAEPKDFLLQISINKSTFYLPKSHLIFLNTLFLLKISIHEDRLFVYWFFFS